MKQIHILCVDDEPDVLDAVVRELEVLEDLFPVETAANAAEAREALERIAADGDFVGVLFCDHIMPGVTGVDFMVELEHDPRWIPTRNVLLTGQAGLDATIKAVNEAGLAHYIAKPWERGELLRVARRQLSIFIKDMDLNPMPYLKQLDVAELGDYLRRQFTEDR
jgi:CheY-like chemotaxis protein